MTNKTTTDDNQPRTKARVAGLLWLLTIVGGMFAYVVGGKFLLSRDAVATAANIIAHESALRQAGAANVFATICYLGVTILIYELLAPLNSSVALFGLSASLLGCTLGAVSSFLFFTLLGLSRTGQPISTVLFLYGHASDIGFVFFGCHLLSIAYIIVRSSFFPRVLGGLLGFTGVCYLFTTFSGFLALRVADHAGPIVAASALIGEGAMMLWLLLKGINVQRWRDESLPAVVPTRRS